MTEVRLEQHEAEDEEARRRVSDDLDKLAAAVTFSDLKSNLVEDIVEVKDQAIGKVKSSAADAANGMLEAVKARVAANPAAALVIGAGVAWRLYRHPPVATLLVGAGVAALMRTDPRQPGTSAEILDHARGAMEVAKSSLHSAGELARAAPAKAGRRIEALDEKFRSAETGDKVLLGAAAVAVPAAVGIAFRRGRR